MLLATYALSTLSIEQKKQRGFIERLQQLLRASAGSAAAADPQFVMAQMEQLSRFAETRHQGKVERWLMPAVRRASAEGAPLLADLESLSAAGGVMLGELRSNWQRFVSRDMEQVCGMYRKMELYCQNLLHRLAKEEYELLPLARRVLSSDGWFSIGAGFLSHDATEHKGKYSYVAQKLGGALANPTKM